MNKISTVFLAFFLVLCGAEKKSFAEDWGATARGVFARLPTSIFEYASADLSEEEKAELMSEGSSENWEISRETPDELVFVARPFQDRVVALRLFRNGVDGSYEAAIGTTLEPICGLELWHIDIAGRIIPSEFPEEPDIKDFFLGDKKIPSRIKHAVQICLDEDGLRASPIFWNDQGMLPAKLDREIVYSWSGAKFRKKARPREYMVPAGARKF